jgi:seryl-tRNA synthetase|tara:strand:- start:250 stop:513 length:264 start_codon:yes stop_codon:yes gene_type:complete
MNDYDIEQMTLNLDRGYQKLTKQIKNIKKKNEDIQNLVNTIETLEDKLIDLYKDKTEKEKEELNHELSDILDNNYVYDLVRNKEVWQ